MQQLFFAYFVIEQSKLLKLEIQISSSVSRKQLKQPKNFFFIQKTFADASS